MPRPCGQRTASLCVSIWSRPLASDYHPGEKSLNEAQLPNKEHYIDKRAERPWLILFAILQNEIHLKLGGKRHGNTSVYCLAATLIDFVPLFLFSQGPQGLTSWLIQYSIIHHWGFIELGIRLQYSQLKCVQCIFQNFIIAWCWISDQAHNFVA